MSDNKIVDILLVEDSPDDAALTIRALSRLVLAPTVVRVEDGVQALEFLHCNGAFASRLPARPPRLVLTDLKMPRMDGVELLKRLRADASTRAVPVVVLSSSLEERDIDECMRNGACSYVRKPVDFDAYSEIVGQVADYWISVNVVAGQL